MIIEKVIFLLTIHAVFPYHFYNPNTHHVLTLFSLNNVPPGYKLLPPPKSHRPFEKEKRSGYCTDAGFICSVPFSKSLTYQFECDQDHQCPKSYKCCQQKCFLHKVCIKATSVGTNPNGNSNGNDNFCRPGFCEKWPYNCRKPYDYAFTSIFECNSDKQCLKDFKCCEQSCFVHKICSRIVTATGNVSIYGGKSEMKEEAVSKPDLTTKIFDDMGESETEKAIKAETDISELSYHSIEAEEATEATKDTEGVIEVIQPIEVTDEEPELDTEETLIDSTKSSEITPEATTPAESSTYEQTKTIPPSLRSTPDGNAIIPEYSEYYYHYGEGNDTNEEYYDNEDETDED